MATTNARILIIVGDTKKGIEFKDIDFDRSRNEVALGIGKTIIDSIYAAAQEEGEA